MHCQTLSTAIFNEEIFTLLQSQQESKDQESIQSVPHLTHMFDTLNSLLQAERHAQYY